MDGLEGLEAVSHFPILLNPNQEWLRRHSGSQALFARHKVNGKMPPLQRCLKFWEATCFFFFFSFFFRFLYNAGSQSTAHWHLQFKPHFPSLQHLSRQSHKLGYHVKSPHAQVTLRARAQKSSLPMGSFFFS